MPSFASQFSKLQHITGYEELNLDDGYKIVPAVHGSWKDCGRRILFIVESMDSADIRHGRMFTSVLGKRDEETNLMVPTMRNLIQHSWELYQEYEGINTLVDTIPTPDDTAIGFVNFNAVKYFHLRDAPRRNAMIACAKRVIQIVERMKPTDVVIFGDAAAYFVMPGAEDREHLRYKRGWTEGRLIGKHRCKVTTTLDIEPLYKEKSGDDEDDAGADDSTSNADLLYYVSRHLMNAFAGRHLHSLRDLKAKPVMVDTIEKFDKLWQKLWDTEDPIGFDSETETLESVHNKIYCHQYALSPDRGYIIPIDHPTSPFTEDERDYIKAKLRKLWAARNPARKKTFVGVNLAFDVRVIRAQFDIPVIYHTLWDIPAGELMLDENISLFNTLAFRVDDGSAEKITAGNLRAILTSYGNDFYYTASFSKEERSTIGHVDLMTHTACQEYCVARGQVVQTDRGRIPIEEIREGDNVLSFNHENRKNEWKRVTKAWQSARPGVRRVRVKHGSGSVVVTEDHPIWSEDRECYVPAGQLRPNERIRLS